MANEPSQPKVGMLKRLAGMIQSSNDSLYTSTYYADPNNRRQLQAIKTDITASIKDIMDSNADNIGEPNISRLFERLLMSQKDGANISEFEKIFGDNEFVNNLANSYMDNRWIRQVDTEIDQVLRYMPKLKEALDVIRDNVLSADSFSKDFLSLRSHFAGKDSEEQFSRNIEDLKTKYDALKLVTDIYDRTATYGETFVYCVPYTKAIQQLMSRKQANRGIVVKTNFGESAVDIVSSNGSFDPIKVDLEEPQKVTDDFNFNIQFESGIISSIVLEEKSSREKRTELLRESLTEQFLNETAIIEAARMGIPVAESLSSIETGGKAYAFSKVTDNDIELDGKLPVHHNFDHTLDDNLQLPSTDDTTADGLVTPRAPVSKVKDINGCIVRILKRERVTPIILSNNICLGYYYWEYDENYELFEERFQSTGMINTITGLRSNGRAEALDSVQRREELLRNIASQLSEKIDATFVNANQDLKKEIYYILKYNDSFDAAATSSNNIRVTYIPPEDIQHIYFDLDEDTGRGISDLNMSLIPAKLWVAIYLTNCLAIMTRGNDKRVYYVKQSVETNTAKTLLKTINEIKKSNFGIRQVENINSILNITGRFNDYIIPRGSDGQSPIEFEVMPGQNVEIKTELLNILEESAINPTGVPLELIQSRQSPDYAMQLTMSNSKFLRMVYSRQSVFQQSMSKLFTKIYDMEYTTTDIISVTLPPPLFINVTNTNQLIMNTNDYCENITNIVMADEQDDTVKARFSKELKMYHLGAYLNIEVINNLINKAKQGKTVDQVSNPENLEQ